MKGYLLVLFALIATSECLLAMPSAQKVEEFAKKILEVAEQLAKLQEEFLSSLNKTSNQKILEQYTTKGVTALNQQVSAKLSQGIRPSRYTIFVGRLLESMEINGEMKDNISKKLFEIQNDQTGEIITEKFMFGGAADDVRYCFIMGRKDLDTGKITLASTIVTAQITLSKNLLIMETTTGKVTEKHVIVKPEEFDDIDIQIIKSHCEYVAIKGLYSFFMKKQGN